MQDWVVEKCECLIFLGVVLQIYSSAGLIYIEHFNERIIGTNCEVQKRHE